MVPNKPTSENSGAYIVVLAGVAAALHVGKLPPAVPLLRDALGLSLLEAGFLLSLVQLAGMFFGLAVGLLADGFGLRRSMLTGLLVLASASTVGGFATTGAQMLVFRALEGCGLLLAVLPGPALIRSLVNAKSASRMLGFWGAYMPFGFASALLVGPWVMELADWRVWWWVLAAVTLGAAYALWRNVPADRPMTNGALHGGAELRERLSATLRAPGPWLMAGCFALYSSQWMAVVGFLPTVYHDAGIGARTAGLLTALVAAVNMIGNIASGLLLQRGVAPQRLLYAGYLTMGLSTVIAYAQLRGVSASPVVQVLCVLAFSAVGGLIPGTLFALAVRVAPKPDAVSTTVGWMHQLSSVGQVCGPPLVAWVATRVGDWHGTWWVTLACSTLGAGLAMRLASSLR